METLISADNGLLLWAVVLLVVAAAIWMEQRFRWAAAIGAIVIILLAGLALSNLHVIPFSSDAYSRIGSIVLPCSIPLFLFKADIKKIVKDTGKLFIVFHVAAVGTIIGLLVSYVVFRGFSVTKFLCTIIGAGAVGGTVNCVAMGNIFDIPTDTLNAYLVVGNFFCGTMIVIFKLLHNTNFIKRFLPRPYTEKMEAEIDQEELAKSGKTLAAAFWGGKEIGMKDIATALATTFVIVGASQLIANWVVSLNPPTIIAQSFGSVYMIMTLLTAILATAIPKFLGNIRGAMELGNIGLLCWFFTIGCSSNLVDILRDGMIGLGIDFIVLIFNLGLAIIVSKFIKATWEDSVMAATATIGGPPTAAAVSIAFGWTDLVIPGILVGLWGYIIGNYFGILVGNVLGVPTLIG